MGPLESIQRSTGTLGIDLRAVSGPLPALHIGEQPAVTQRAAADVVIVDVNHVAVGVGEIHQLVVGRKSDAVRDDDVVGDVPAIAGL